METFQILEVLEAEKSFVQEAACLAAELWPSHTPEELEAEFSGLLQKGSCVFFLAVLQGKTIGFAQCQLRTDYVEGTSSSPVGYLEGIYVRPAFRGNGVAMQLLEACQDWCRQKRCSEFASDCTLENQESFLFHKKCGFQEANRIICFVKKL